MADSKNIPNFLQLSLFSIERVKDWITWLSKDGRIIYANSEASNVLGYSKEELAHLTIFQIDRNYTPEIWATHFANLRAIGSRTFETRHHKKDGSTVEVEINANYIEFDGIEYNCAIVRDISQRKRAEKREHTKNRILELVAHDANLKDILSYLVRSVEEQDPQKICSILFVDDTGKRLHNYASPSLPSEYVEAIDGLLIAPDMGSCGTAAFLGETILVEDIQADKAWKDFRALAEKFSLRSCWSVPIVIDSNKVVGTFAVYHRVPKSPSVSDIEQLEYLANMARITIERHRIAEEFKLSDLVFKNSREGMMIMDADNKILAINPAFTEITNFLLEDVVGKQAEEFISKGHAGEIAQIINHELREKGYWQGEVWEIKKNGEEYVKDVSINTIYDEEGDPYRRVALFSDVTEKKKNEELIWTEANLDPLTHLPNRRFFRARLEQEITKANLNNKKLALLFLDLDRFKQVNDASGHQGGDALLAEVANRLRQSVRSTDCVARIGGDEFTITLAEIEDTSSIQNVAKKIIGCLEAPFEINTHVHYISASVGITFYPEDAKEADALIKNADQAMYAAKNLGRNQFCFYKEQMQSTANKRVQQMRGLRNALQDDEFEAYFQPIIELQTGNVTKAEALIRWKHKSVGMISPADFIPLAEETGLIHDLGNWMMRKSIAQAQLWRESLHPDFQISVNISPVQFKDPTYFAQWVEMLVGEKFASKSICIEITEGLLLDASESTYQQLLQFREASIQIAIDDFGTGYSSLAYINRMDVDFIKIDKVFIDNLSLTSSDYALVEAMIVMAHKLGLLVVAEGVETELQRDLLKSLRCDYAQGFLYSRPLPLNEFTVWVSNHNQVH